MRACSYVIRCGPRPCHWIAEKWRSRRDFAYAVLCFKFWRKLWAMSHDPWAIKTQDDAGSLIILIWKQASKRNQVHTTTSIFLFYVAIPICPFLPWEATATSHLWIPHQQHEHSIKVTVAFVQISTFKCLRCNSIRGCGSNWGFRTSCC